MNFPLLFLSLVLFTLIEVGIFVGLAQTIGFLPSLAGLVLAAFFGFYFIKSQGIVFLLAAQKRIAQGELPGDEVLSAIVRLLAGLMFLIPGYFSDLVALFLLFSPLKRRILGRFLGKSISSIYSSKTSRFAANEVDEPIRPAHKSHQIIEAEFEEIPDKKPKD